MKKHVPLAAGAALVISGLLLHFSGVATAGPQGASGGGNPWSGTYYTEFEFNGIPLSTIAHFNADGSSILVDMFQFGLGGVTDKTTPAPGTWWKSGPREMTDVRLQFGFTAEGIPITVYRHTTITTFDPSFDTGTGISYTRVYDLSLGEDPLDPDQGTEGATIPYTLRRLIP